MEILPPCEIKVKPYDYLNRYFVTPYKTDVKTL